MEFSAILIKGFAIKNGLTSTQPISNASAKTRGPILYGINSKFDGVECEMLNKILDKIMEDIKGRYSFDEYVSRGGAGAIFKLLDKVLEVPRALKVSRPIEGKAPLLAKIMSDEIKRLKGTSHPNVVGIHYFGSIILEKQEWPFYIMDFVEGGMDLWEFFEEKRWDSDVLISLLSQFVSGLNYIHEMKMIHGDVKFENALISPDLRVYISDLGSARFLSPGDPKKTVFAFTKPWAHPDLIQFNTITVTDPDRTRANVPRSELRIDYDLYPVGRNILRLIKMIDDKREGELESYLRSYLKLMGARLLLGHNLTDERPFNLPNEGFLELRYSTLNEVLSDLKKVGNDYFKDDVPELNQHYPRTLQTAFPGACPFTRRLEKVLNNPLLKRLAEVSQLGMIVYLYPTANHTRLEHTLGVFTMTIKYCQSLINDPVNPFFRQVVSTDHLRALLCAALCHDLGHYGMAHDFEEAHKDVFSHSKLTSSILRGEIQDEDIDSLLEIIENDWKVDPKFVADILESNPSNTDEPIINRLLHSIIDGPMDADKADYLIRDSRKVGIPYGQVIDVSRLIKCLTVVFETFNNKTYIALGIYEKAKIPAESVAFARYALFGCVYWHHTSRALKSMLHRVIWETLPIVDGRKKEYLDFREEFREFVQKQFLDEAQISLFEDETSDFRPGHNPLSQGDLRILKWLFDRSSLHCQEILNNIVERKIVKRLIVISSLRHSGIWDKLQRLRKSVDHKKFIQIQQRLQASLVEFLVKKGEGQKTTTVVTEEKISEEDVDFVRSLHQQGKVLVFLDIPPNRPGSRVDLQFLSEERKSGKKYLGKPERALEDSIVWKALNDGFLESVGKIRVFIDARVSNVFEGNLSKDAIERALQSVVLHVD